MAEFKPPSRGGNVVHNLDLPGLAKRRTKRIVGRRRQQIRVERIEVMVPAPAPDPAALRASEPAYVVPAPEVPAEKSGQDNEARQQIDLLERRLAKMARLLDERDGETISKRDALRDDGVASVFREVQGLDGDAEDGERKKELMSSIFEANVKLRELVTSASRNDD